MSHRIVAGLLLIAAAACSNQPYVSGGTVVPASGTVWPDEGPATWDAGPTSADISASDLRTRLYAFAHDSMMGRRIGEPGNVKGTEYIAREFARLGLRPAGENGTYFQPLPFGPARFDSASARLRVAEATLVPRRDWIPVAPSAFNGYAASANLAGVPAVFAGRLGDTAVVLDPARFRGKVAVFLAPERQAASAARSLAPRCDSVPDNFGAAAAIALEAARRAAPPAPRPAGPVRDLRAHEAGAVAVFVAGLDPSSPAASSAFASRMMMQPAPTPAGAPAGASITDAAAERVFGRPLNDLVVGATGAAVTARWSYDPPRPGPACTSSSAPTTTPSPRRARGTTSRRAR
jgi:hypothetical protein